MGAPAKAGIEGLVYALAGYDATRAEVIQAFKMFVREEAREYERELPNQLYDEWYRLYQLPKPERNKPWKFKTRQSPIPAAALLSNSSASLM